MSNQAFQFKEFCIEQNQCAMKVGTDGVLIGAWTPFEGAKRILDIGTGTGLIALMAAQRNSEARVDAIEIDASAFEQAQINIAHSEWSDRIHVFHRSLQQYADYDTQISYDVIVSNPPFYNATLKPDDEARAIARHTDSLPWTDIMQYASDHLTPRGLLSLIFPPEAWNELVLEAIGHQLTFVRLCDIITREGKPAKRQMALFARASSGQQPFEREQLFIRDASGTYSEQYRQLTADFYLHLK